MTKGSIVQLTDPTPEAQRAATKRLPGPARDEIYRATVDVLAALKATGLPVSAWYRVLGNARTWIGGKESSRRNPR